MKILLISVSPEEYLIRRSSYNFNVFLPACPKDKPYTEFMVTDQEDTKVIYQGLKQEEIERVPFPVPADVIVRDIFQSDQLESKGVFALPEGRMIPTEKELSDARKKRHALLTAWALEGDRLYSQFGERGIQHIADYCKRAVVELGETRAWVFQSASAAKIECPACGTMLRPLSSGLSPAVCKECHYILDAERYNPEPVAETKPRGRRKQEEAVAE